MLQKFQFHAMCNNNDIYDLQMEDAYENQIIKNIFHALCLVIKSPHILFYSRFPRKHIAAHKPNTLGTLAKHCVTDYKVDHTQRFAFFFIQPGNRKKQRTYSSIQTQTGQNSYLSVIC